MAASTDIKFYVHTNTSAPQLDNVQGSMIAVLDACLVNGFGSQAVSSIAATGTTATVTFNSAHNFMQYQVIEIAGAAQSDYNGQHRILTAPSANSITFELPAAPSVSTATGTITCRLPPLGWEKPFGNTGGKAAYRSSNLLLPSRPFLRVVDELDPAYNATYAKYAKVGIVEDMTDINTMLGVQAPYDAASPNKNWVGAGSGTSAINGWAKWFYASSAPESTNGTKAASPTNGVRSWIVVGNSETFYIFNKSHHSPNEKLISYGFGKLKNLSKVGVLPYFLAASDDNSAASSALYTGIAQLTATNNIPTAKIFMFRNYKNEANLATASSRVFAGGAAEYTGYTATFAPPDNNISVFNTEYVLAEGGNIPRGVVPILRWLHQSKPYTHLQPINETGHMLLACNCVSYTYDGQILFDLGAL